MVNKVCELTGNPEHDYCSECGTCFTCLDLENDDLAGKNKQLNIVLTKANYTIDRLELENAILENAIKQLKDMVSSLKADLQDVSQANKNLFAECKVYQGELKHADLKFLDLQQKFAKLEDKKDMVSHISKGWLSKHDEKLQQAISLLEQVYMAG